jgi:hypothetical protein
VLSISSILVEKDSLTGAGPDQETKGWRASAREEGPRKRP